MSRWKAAAILTAFRHAAICLAPALRLNLINLSHNGNLQLYLGITVGFALYNKDRKHVPFKKTHIIADDLLDKNALPNNYRFRSVQHTFERGAL